MPSPRGKLDDALTKKSGKLQLHIVSPESPRPAEMLEGVTISGADDLTADDGALHELMISRAYEHDRPMTDEMHSLEMSHALRFLGGRVERSDVRQSLNRLKRTTVSYGSVTKDGRRYEDVPLIESWIEVGPGFDTIRYRLPEPLRELLRRQPSYGYIELAAFPRMKSKFSGRLYKKLALATAKQKWTPGGDNTVTVSGTPDEVATWIGFPREKDGKLHVGKMRRRFLERVKDDFKDVRAFRMSVKLDEPGGRGNPLAKITFTLRLNAPSRHMTASRFSPADAQGYKRIGSKDLPHLRVESRTWRRAAAEFGKLLGRTHRGFHDLFQVALNEALSGEAVTEGFGTREYRGERLLAAMESRGADYGAWGFVCEEADIPDLALKDGRSQMEAAAEAARMERIGWERKEAKPAPFFVVADENEGMPEAGEMAEPAVTFETCREIVLTVDEAHNIHDVEGIIAGPIQRWKYTGSRHIYLTLRYCVGGGAYDRWRVGSYKVSETDLEGLLKRLSRHLDGPEEYVS